MSLQDLQHQIDTATNVAKRYEVEHEAKGHTTSGTNNGEFPNRVRSGIRREFTAFQKVLETSRGRLQELQAMQVTLDEMEQQHSPAKKPQTKIKTPMKKFAKSPHWLPALGRGKKKFFAGDDTRDEVERTDDAGNSYEREPPLRLFQKQQYSKSYSEASGAEPLELSTYSESDGSNGEHKSSPPEVLKKRDWNLAVESIQSEFDEPSTKDDDDKYDVDRFGMLPEGPSLEARERSFRTNLQARALALSLGRPTGANEQSGESSDPFHSSDHKAKEKEMAKGRRETSEYRPESLTEFASRLEQSIRMMKTTELVQEGANEELHHHIGGSDTEEEPGHGDASFDGGEGDRAKDPKWPKFKKTLSKLKGKRSSSFIKALHSVDEAAKERSTITGGMKDRSQLNKEANYKKGGVKLNSPGNLLRSLSTRVRSFHTDGWKGSVTEDVATETMTEESIAAQELKAREAYIKAMQQHQALLRSGKDEHSAEVLESQKVLQACFADIEHWEAMKEGYKSGPADASSPRATRSLENTFSSDAFDAVADLAIEEQMSGDPQDICYVGEKERKTREAYIKAMRHHQELIARHVKPDSEEWIESEKEQQLCQAKLKYWESRTHEIEGVPVFEESWKTRTRNDPQKTVYKVSQENKEDKQTNLPLIESILAAARDKIFPQSTPLKAKESITNNKATTNSDNIDHKLQEPQVDSAIDTFCAVVFPLCLDPGWSCRSPSPLSKTNEKFEESAETNKRRSKALARKGSSDRKNSTTFKASRSRSRGDEDDRTTENQQKSQKDIESKAMKILWGLTASGSDEPEPDSPPSPSMPVSTEVRQHPRVSNKVPTFKRKYPKKEETNDDADDSSAVSRYINEGAGGLFC